MGQVSQCCWHSAGAVLVRQVGGSDVQEDTRGHGPDGCRRCPHRGCRGVQQMVSKGLHQMVVAQHQETIAICPQSQAGVQYGELMNC